MDEKVVKQLIRSSSIAYKPCYYDVGMNLTDHMFSGRYRGKRHHENDIHDVLYKAKLFNVEKMLLTGSTLTESRRTIEMAKKFNKLNEIKLKETNGDATKLFYPTLYSTVGVHPCSVMEFLSKKTTIDEHLDQLRSLVRTGVTEGIVRAFGEIGLDYDRLFRSPKKEQIEFFELQLKLACEFELPLFLHMRAAFDDFVKILMPFINGTRSDGLELKNKKVLIHSFTGTAKELEYFINQDGFYISVNGCSLREEDSLEVVKNIPLDRLMLETDAPWCLVKTTHASYKYITECPNYFYPFENTRTEFGKINGATVSYNDFLPIPIVNSDRLEKHYNLFDKDRKILAPLIKGRNEPSLIGFNAEIMSKLMNVEPQELIERCYENSEALFG